MSVRRSSGLDTGPHLSVPDFSGMSREERIQAMVEWFSENYTDPVHNSPYISAEGGYQYIWGGPYDAREQLSDNFGRFVSEDEIEEAVKEVEAEGTYQWTASDSRLVEEFYEDDPAEASLVDSLPEDHEREEKALVVRRELDVLEQAIREWKKDRPLLGHNQPPEAISDGLTLAEIAEVEASISSVRLELDKVGPSPASAQKAESLFRRIAAKLLKYVAGGGAVFIGGMLAKAGQDAYDKLAANFTSAADALAGWISTFPTF
jgi:hypothetical protein